MTKVIDFRSVHHHVVKMSIAPVHARSLLRLSAVSRSGCAPRTPAAEIARNAQILKSPAKRVLDASAIGAAQNRGNRGNSTPPARSAGSAQTRESSAKTSTGGHFDFHAETCRNLPKPRRRAA